MLLQLNPPLPVTTPKGKGLAHLVLDYGAEHHLIWTVFIDATGECWSFPNPEIRAQSNATMGRQPSKGSRRGFCNDCGKLVDNACYDVKDCPNAERVKQEEEPEDEWEIETKWPACSAGRADWRKLYAGGG